MKLIFLEHLDALEREKALLEVKEKEMRKETVKIQSRIIGLTTAIEEFKKVAEKGGVNK